MTAGEYQKLLKAAAVKWMKRFNELTEDLEVPAMPAPAPGVMPGGQLG
jgi:hypothetical protein